MLRAGFEANFKALRALLRESGKGAVLWGRLFSMLLAVGGLYSACQPPSASPPPSAASADHANGDAGAQAARPSATLPGEPASGVPVEADDAILGEPGALVTMVVFVDFECPFCARAHKTVQELAASYPRSDLRIVYKNNPLPFHPSARPAARAAQAVLAIAGPDVYFVYATRLFDRQRALSETNLIALAEEAGVARGAFLAEFRSAAREQELSRDVELARSLGATGTPSFRINGATLVGAQPIEAFRELVDHELSAARALLASGAPRASIYARRVEENLRSSARAAEDEARAEIQAEAEVVNKVPVGNSPVRGPADALVTIVEFQDFECPFCKRVQPTIDEVLRKYAGRVRLVFKNNPLPFHERAHPAAVLALEARAQKGDAGFWRAVELLFESSPSLDEGRLLEIAARLGLNAGRVRAALSTDKHRAAIETDADLADDLDARGTPCFFINGHRLVGAQPIETFSSLVDAELTKAEGLVKSGVKKSKLYEHVLKDAVEPGAPPRKNVPAPSADQPSRGSARAPVVMQIFSDFECPFCKRVAPTLEALQKEFGNDLRIVWRNYPLEFHKHARLAAIAALEARAQGGDGAFWRMHDRLYAAQTDPGGLERDRLETYAAELGLDRARFSRALDDGRHDAALTADRSIAAAANITGTPSFVVNGYFISGAQHIAKFRKIVRRALTEAKAKPQAREKRPVAGAPRE
jgi:protein-disulfide isomerase